MARRIEPKPCVCGARPEYVFPKTNHGHMVLITCRRCGRRTKQHLTLAAALNEWHAEKIDMERLDSFVAASKNVADVLVKLCEAAGRPPLKEIENFFAAERAFIRA